jgi:hypothetical protein
MIRVNGVSLRVVGIIPRGFNGLSGTAQLWVPATMAPRLSYGDYLVTNQNFISVAGRLRAGVTLEQARAELAVLGGEIDRATPSQSSNPAARFAATALSLNEARIDPTTRRPMFLLLAAAGCLLLLACANVAGCCSAARYRAGREIAIRVATGASRGRIVGQLLSEAAYLAVGGGVGEYSLPCRWRASSRFRRRWRAAEIFMARSASSPHRRWTLACCSRVSCCARDHDRVAAFCRHFARRASILTSDLKDGGAGGGVAGRRSQIGARQWIVGAETALAVALLFCGGALIASWRRMETTDLGF